MFFRAKKVLQFKGAVVSDLISKDKYSAIDELVAKAPILQHIKKREEFLKAIYEREKEKTTGFGHGVAVAHGKIPSIKDIKIALGISQGGIAYNATDGKPVYLLFLVASDPAKSQEYLEVLSYLMKIVRNQEFRERLLESKTPQEAEALLDQQFESFGKIKVEK